MSKRYNDPPRPRKYHVLDNVAYITHMQPPMPEPPTVQVRRLHHPRGDLLIIERCPHCGERHQHGAAKAGCGDHGHRQAHCREIAWNNRGYYLVEPCPGEQAAVKAG